MADATVIDIERLSVLMATIKAEEKRIKDAYQETRTALIDAMIQTGMQEYILDGADGPLKITVTTADNVTYSVETLHERLPIEIFKQITTVNVDKKQLDALFKVGKIPLEILEDACTKIETKYILNVRPYKQKEYMDDPTG